MDDPNDERIVRINDIDFSVIDHKITGRYIGKDFEPRDKFSKYIKKIATSIEKHTLTFKEKFNKLGGV